jgi:hypothetical protein
MVTQRDPAAVRVRRPGALILAVLGIAALLSACGSGASPAAASAATVQATCSQVSSVLSDGPDPGADPVGYAQAQVLPLGQIRTPDATLRAAISGLASAYKEYYASNGASHAASAAVAAASKRLDAICPGATS